LSNLIDILERINILTINFSVLINGIC
jgi:hypothetical protein